MINRTPDSSRPVRERAVRPAAAGVSPPAGRAPARPVRADTGTGTPGTAAGQRPIRQGVTTPAGGARAPGGRTAPAAKGRAPGASVPSDLSGSRPEHALIIVRELTALIEQENAALESNHLDEVQATLSLKQSLTRGYLELAIALRKNPTHLEDVPEDVRNDLRATAHRLDELMKRNSILLKSRMEAANRVMGAIVDAVKEAQSRGAATYTDGATMSGDVSEHRRLAVAVNKEF